MKIYINFLCPQIKMKNSVNTRTLKFIKGKSPVYNLSTIKQYLYESPTQKFISNNKDVSKKTKSLNKDSKKIYWKQDKQIIMQEAKNKSLKKTKKSLDVISPILQKKYQSQQKNSLKRVLSTSGLLKQEDTELKRKLAYNTNRVQQMQNKINEKLKKALYETKSTKASQQVDVQIYENTALLPKLKIQDFDFLNLIEDGKQSRIYKAKHKKTQFCCIIKVTPLSKLNKSFIQPVRQLKNQFFLNHPNIVQLYSYFVDIDCLFLVMELCANGNLYQKLTRQGRISQGQSKKILKQICHALQYMHDNDILHRDIKPQNIFIHQNIFKIGDFGCSVKSPLLRDTLCGSPLYYSPEIVERQIYDSKIDVWNLGVLTYELLYGKVPFEIRKEADLTKIIYEEVYFPKNIPTSVQIKDFIIKCLKKNPKERFSVTQLLDHQFLVSKNLKNI